MNKPSIAVDSIENLRVYLKQQIDDESIEHEGLKAFLETFHDDLGTLKAQVERELGPSPCCGEWDTCKRPCTPRGEKIGEQRRLEGQTIEQWAERAKISESNLEEETRKRTDAPRWPVDNSGSGFGTEQCGCPMVCDSRGCRLLSCRGRDTPGCWYRVTP